MKRGEEDDIESDVYYTDVEEEVDGELTMIQDYDSFSTMLQ
jgi:hypothetical protein